jgi:hypothetical protein
MNLNTHKKYFEMTLQSIISQMKVSMSLDMINVILIFTNVICKYEVYMALELKLKFKTEK